MTEFIRGMNKSSINGKNPPPILKFEKKIFISQSYRIGIWEMMGLSELSSPHYFFLFSHSLFLIIVHVISKIAYRIFKLSTSAVQSPILTCGLWSTTKAVADRLTRIPLAIAFIQPCCFCQNWTLKFFTSKILYLWYFSSALNYRKFKSVRHFRMCFKNTTIWAFWKTFNAAYIRSY